MAGKDHLGDSLDEGEKRIPTSSATARDDDADHVDKKFEATQGARP